MFAIFLIIALAMLVSVVRDEMRQPARKEAR